MPLRAAGRRSCLLPAGVGTRAPSPATALWRPTERSVIPDARAPSVRTHFQEPTPETLAGICIRLTRGSSANKLCKTEAGGHGNDTGCGATAARWGCRRRLGQEKRLENATK